MKIGHKLKHLRDSKGYSQEYIAAQLGITQPAYQKIESNDTSVSLDKIQKLATLFKFQKRD